MTDPSATDVVPDVGATRICVAPMRRRHLKSVLATEAKVYPNPWSMSLYLGELAQPDSRCYLVARSGAVVVGHAGVLFIEDEGHVTTVAVEPAWQRRQVATRLLLAQFRHAIDRGATALTLEVRVGSRGAQELYRRFGFAPAGVRKGYYADSGEDAIIMWVHDLATPQMGERLAAIEAGISGETVVEGVRRG